MRSCLAIVASVASLSACSSSNRVPEQAPTATGGSSSSTGGTASASGGSSGTQDAAVSASSACDGKTTAAPEFVSSLETDDPHLPWFAYDDGSSTERAGTGFDEGGPAQGGALETLHAAHISGSGLDDWGAGFGVGYGCIDVSRFDGIAFWAKSEKAPQALRLHVVTPPTQAAAEGGDCPITDACYDNYGKDFEVGSDWQRYTATWDELAQQGWGTPADWTAIVLSWNFAVPAPAYDIWIDEVVLYSGTPPSAPVDPPEAADASEGAGGAGGAASDG